MTAFVCFLLLSLYFGIIVGLFFFSIYLESETDDIELFKSLHFSVIVPATMNVILI